MLDLLFRNATATDGTGAPSFTGDVGVKDGKITFRREEAAEEVDAAGLTLTPGFIDVHSHDDYCIGKMPAALCKIGQGVTTEVVGNCGDSAYPVNPAFRKDMGVFANMTRDLLQMPYETFTDLNGYEAYARTVPMTQNFATLVGHNSLRFAVMGTADRKPTAKEMEEMKALLERCMRQGAFGFSTGLVYIPGVYADEEEVVELCRVIRPYGGIYATHMRNEADRLYESVEESVRIAGKAGVKLEISHFKARGRKNFGKSREAIGLIEQKVKEGMTIGFDTYPYEANMSGVSVCIPPKYFAGGMEKLLNSLSDPEFRKKVASEMDSPDCGYDNFYQCAGGFENILITSALEEPEAEGKTVAAYAKETGRTPMDTFFDSLIRNKGVYNGVFFSMDPEEMKAVYRHPLCVPGTDGLCFDLKAGGHPRTWNTFIRTLTACTGKEIGFEEAVRKQTLAPAVFWGLRGKGRIAEGYDADLVLLDRKNLREVATYLRPNVSPEGVEAVYVSGKCAYREGKLTGITAGKILKRG